MGLWQRLLLAGSAFLFIVSPSASYSQAPDGIPRDLARQRAQQVKGVRYQLSYNIVPRAGFFSGHEVLRFVQNADDRGILPEWLDFRESSITRLTINGQPASGRNSEWAYPAACQAAQAGRERR